MKYQELLERRIVLDPDRNGRPLIIYENPSHTELRKLLDQYGELRGSASADGSFYVWSAHDWVHHTIGKYLGHETMQYYLYFAKTRDVQAEEWQRVMRRRGDIFVGAKYDPDDKIPLQHPMVQRVIDRPMRESVFVRGDSISDVDGVRRPVNLHRNPGREEYQALLKRSYEHSLRGFCYENGDIIVWDSYVADHGSVETLLRENGFTEWGIRIVLPPRPHAVVYYVEDINNARNSGEPDFDDAWVRNSPRLAYILGDGYDVRGD